MELLHEYLWWFEWIICRKVNREKKDATLVWAVRLQNSVKLMLVIHSQYMAVIMKNTLN